MSAGSLLRVPRRDLLGSIGWRARRQYHRAPRFPRGCAAPPRRIRTLSCWCPTGIPGRVKRSDPKQSTSNERALVEDEADRNVAEPDRPMRAHKAREHEPGEDWRTAPATLSSFGLISKRTIPSKRLRDREDIRDPKPHAISQPSAEPFGVDGQHQRSWALVSHQVTP
jgi:hypothetical protein